MVSEIRYKAWGEVRYASGATPTDYKFTGQLETDTGLYFYVARFYDSYLNRWIQPDTIIPDQYNTQDWDRYGYVRNNPVNFNDPSGHDPCPGKKGDCKQLGPDVPIPLIPDSIRGPKRVGTTVPDGNWVLVTNGNGIVTWYEIPEHSGSGSPEEMLTEAELKHARMQGTVIIGEVSWSLVGDKWVPSGGTGCQYSNSVHCVYPYEADSGHYPTAAVPDGGITPADDTYIYVQVQPSSPNDRVFADNGEVFNAYDGCPACVNNAGVDLLSKDPYGHYGYNGRSGAGAWVFIWLWVPGTSSEIRYGNKQ